MSNRVFTAEQTKKLEQIIYHYTIPGDRVNAGNIQTPP